MSIITRFYDWFIKMPAPVFWFVYAAPLIVLWLLIGSYEESTGFFSNLNYDVIRFVEQYAFPFSVGLFLLWLLPLLKDPFGSQEFAFPIWLLGILLWVPLIAYLP